MHFGGGEGGSTRISPPDGGWGWVVVFASFMIHVIADGVAYTFGIFFIELTRDLNATKSATSWIVSIMVGVTLSSGPLAGAFVNKWGCRPVSVLGSALAALGFGISYFAQEVTFLYVSIGLIGGLGLGLIYLPAIVSVTCYFEQRRAFATGIAVCGSGVGTFVLAPIMELLIREYQWRVSLLVAAIMLLHCGFFSLLFRPLNPPKPKPKPIETTTSPVSIYRSDYKEEDSLETFLPASSQPGAEATAKVEDALVISASHPVLPLLMISKEAEPMRRHSFKSAEPVTFKRNPSPPFYSSAQLITHRKDIFYSGSLNNLNIIPPPPSHETREEKGKGCCGSFRCPPELKSALNRMMDFSILKDPVFLFFAISNFLTSIGYNIPYIYIVDMAVKDGRNSKASAGFLLSVIGLSNTISRVVLGYLSDKPCVNRLYLYNSALVVAGIATGIVSHTSDIWWLRFYGVVFGVSVGVLVSLTSVILVDLLGLEKLTNAFGLLLLFQGLASLIGPPLVGYLVDKDKRNDYRPGFWLAGSLMALSGAMLFFIPLLINKFKK